MTFVSITTTNSNINEHIIFGQSTEIVGRNEL